ncbi:hypothetical protein HDU99_009881 [Rhizoclosmatium hyalinum]|nr:hypothetical protein HDU99_009881 [Rhizoclosmatium hyalinum]
MTVYDVFEGFVCFWFIACRMNNAWIPYLKYGDCNSKDLRERIRFMLVLYTKEVRRNASNQLITKAMAGMLEEMEEVANTGVRRGFESISGFGGCDLGLATVSSGESSALRCFMGFLGMDICNKVGWKGRTEESWKLFWKLNN